MARQPFAQGDLDGLCGMYAIVNAYRRLMESALGKKDASSIFHKGVGDLFHVTLKSIPQRRYPDVILEGTNFSDLKRMAIAAKNWANERLADRPYRARLRYPFQKRTITDMGTFWSYFDGELNGDCYGAAILGLKEPSLHWVCVYKSESSRIHFYDSNGLDTRKNRSSIGLKPSTSSNKVRLDYRETIVIKVESK